MFLFEEKFGTFSHFSFELSYKDFIITDLQGFGTFLVDPVIHTESTCRINLEGGNQKDEGVNSFFMA